MTQAAVTQTAAVTTEISNSKDDSNNMTTHNCRNAVNSKQQTQTASAKACAAPGAVYTTETSVASGCVYATKACAAHRRIFTTKARAKPRRVYTTEESASSGRVYIMVTCAAPEGVYT